MKLKQSIKLSSFLYHFLAPYKTMVLMYTLVAMITGLWAPVNNFLIKVLIDALEGHAIESNVMLAVWPAIFFIFNYEAHNWLYRTLGLINCHYAPIIKNNIIREGFSHIHGHSHQFFQVNLSGRIAGQLNTLADNVEQLLYNIYNHLVRSVVLLLISVIGMYYVHTSFALALLAWLVIFVCVSLVMSRHVVALASQQAEAESALSGELVDSISNANNVRIFAKQSFELAHIESALLLTQNTFRNNVKYNIRMRFLQGLSLSLMLAVMLYFLISLRMQKLVTIGDFALILGLSGEVGFMTWWAMDKVVELNASVGKCKQSLSQLFTAHAVTDHENASELKVHRGEISFEDVFFYYKGSEPLFNTLSVTIHAGQKVGLVGYSGSGKTTFANLILRIYNLQAGRICIDGQPIDEVTQSSLRSSIAVIPQDPSLFQRNLMENIRYGDPTASDDEVILASKRAHCHEFIMQLANGYDTLAGERGISLSGGQRQRLAIARAVLKNAPILILDEATSQLDSVAEQYIQHSLKQLMADKTTIIIAHRLSTLLDMDRILVFDRGCIVEDGTHDELLGKNGLYAKLWHAQVGGMLPDSAV